MHVRAERDSFTISTDPARIDLDVVFAFLTASYWSPGIPRDTLKKAIDHSIPFGVYQASQQVGFARVVTDRATFAYLADVFILPEYRGRGLSTWLMEFILAHPDLQGLRRFCLLTRDAHELYARYGFRPMADASRYMERWDPEIYKRSGGAVR